MEMLPYTAYESRGSTSVSPRKHHLCTKTIVWTMQCSVTGEDRGIKSTHVSVATKSNQIKIDELTRWRVLFGALLKCHVNSGRFLRQSSQL